MKTHAPKTTSSAPQSQKGSQPFFKKEGEGAFFSQDQMQLKAGKEQQAASPFFGAQSGSTPFFMPSVLQPKLTIGQPGDKYEQEADAMADQVVQKLAEPSVQKADVPKTNNHQLATNNSKPVTPFTPPALQPQSEEAPEKEGLEQEEVLQSKPIFESNGDPEEGGIQRKCAACEQKEKGALSPKLQLQSLPSSSKPAGVQRKCTACQTEAIQPGRIQMQGGRGAESATPGLESRLNATKGGGSPLPKDTRSSMESAFGADFSSVRVHTNSSSVQMNQELGAQAFTHGSDVYFNQGKYDTGSGDGQRLLAHELTHVVQQGGKIRRKLGDGHDLSSPRFAGNLRLEAAFDGERYIKKGSKGEHVKKIQLALIEDGFDLPEHGPDKSFGKETKAKLQEYQRKYNLKPDGWVGPETMAHMDRKFGGMPPKPYDPDQDEDSKNKGKPVIKFKSIKFTGDHGVIQNNRADWGDSGALQKPEWVEETSILSGPVSYEKGKTISLELNFDVFPEDLPSTKIDVKGHNYNNLRFLQFRGSSQFSGGKNQTMALTAAGSLPDKIMISEANNIIWKIGIGSNKGVKAVSFGHDILVTYGTPSGGVTFKRLKKAIELTQGFGKDPHNIVSGQMRRFPRYNLDIAIDGNIWPLADDIDLESNQAVNGADCQTIVRFVQAVNKMIGLPGNAKGIVVFAHPDAPTTPLTGNILPGGSADNGMWKITVGGRKAGLFDGGDNYNNYEAALEFEYGGKKLYYPGGVPGGHGIENLRDVLFVFKQMAWKRFDPVLGKSVPDGLIFCYNPPC